MGLYSHVGPLKSLGILAWHSITGCDTMGRFVEQGKKTWWNLYMSLDHELDKDILQGLCELGEGTNLLFTTQKELAKFITLGYAKGSETLPSARWQLRTKKMAEGEKLPPTPDAFKQHLLRALVQAHTWRHANLPLNPLIDVSNGEHGWKWDGKSWIPIPFTASAATSTILELIKCNCHGTCDNGSCKCYRECLACTDMSLHG